MREMRLLLKVKCHFSAKESSSSNEGVLGENSLKSTPRKRSLRNKRHGGSVQEVEIISVGYLEISSPSRKEAGTERSTAPAEYHSEAEEGRRMAAISYSAAVQAPKVSCNGNCNKEDDRRRQKSA